MRDPERDKSDDGRDRRRNDGVRHHAEIGVQLPHFLPPLIIDGERRESAQRGQDDECGYHKGRAADAAPSTSALDFSYWIRHENSPLTIVATGPPRKLCPSNGELRLLDNDPFTS